MELLLTALVGTVLLVAPPALAALLVHRAPMPAALLVAVMLWGLGPRVANPDSPSVFDIDILHWILLDRSPRWRALLGGSCQATGFVAVVWLCVRTGRRWRRGEWEEAPAADPAEDPIPLTCGRCGTTAPADTRTCPKCGDAYWRGEA